MLKQKEKENSKDKDDNRTKATGDKLSNYFIKFTLKTQLYYFIKENEYEK